MGEVTCAVCGTPFEEDGALDMGASKIERDGQAYWFCSPYCEKEFLGAPEKYGMRAGKRCECLTR